MNFRLRLAIDKAKSGNVPNDNIDRAIKAGTGEGKEGLTKEMLYEGFGPGGVAVLVEAITDNSNRTAAEIRGTMNKLGGTMGGQNSVSWMFMRSGVIRLAIDNIRDKLEDIELAVIDAGATDVQTDDEHLVILCPPEQLKQVQAVLQQMDLQSEADIEYIPTTTTTPDDAARTQLHTLLEALDSLDDVTAVISNEN